MGKDDELTYGEVSEVKKCKWVRSFDGHFNISCANETGERGNADFKGDKRFPNMKWNFKYCPYCGREIEVRYK